MKEIRTHYESKKKEVSSDFVAFPPKNLFISAGGLEEFADSFSSGKLQFGVISVRLSSDVFPKIVLVHWVWSLRLN